MRITRRTRGDVDYFSRLNNREVQCLDASEVNGINVMKPLHIEVIEHKDIEDERAFSILSEILSKFGESRDNSPCQWKTLEVRY